MRRRGAKEGRLPHDEKSTSAKLQRGKSLKRYKEKGRSNPIAENRLAVIALGANSGDSKGEVLKAIDCLQRFSAHPLRKSSLWETAPVDCPPGSSLFVNAVVGLVPRERETPESLLQKLQSLEKQFGRKPKKVLNEPRPLDLDLIAFGKERRRSRILKLPHPRAHKRRFVLAPLAEIAPELVLPGQSRTVKDLLASLGAYDAADVRRIKI